MSLRFFSLLIILLPLNTFATTRLCYFSLNNEKEFEKASEFVDKLKFPNGQKIQVKEYLTSGDNPEDAFKEMIKNVQKEGAQCNGLVISGHHTGSFGGKRAKGKLSLDFLEKLSCMPEFQDFFQDVSSLWLQGCRTLGSEVLSNGTNQAEGHRDRVAHHRVQDGLDQNTTDLELEFTATLDNDNPLSSRYMRMFPQASVYGWTDSAPGVDALSEDSLLYHIANIAQFATGMRPGPFTDPRRQLDSTTAMIYANVFLDLLNKNKTPHDPGCVSEDVAVNGWMAHGGRRVGGTKGTYGFDNTKLNAFASDPGNFDLKKAKEIECLLKKDNLTIDQLKDALDQALKNGEKVLEYTTNAIWNKFITLRNNGKFEELDVMRKMLREDPRFTLFLQEKFAADNDRTGLIMKVHYYGMYKDISGTGILDFENDLISIANQNYFSRPIKDTDWDLKIYNRVLASALYKNDIISHEDILGIIKMARNNTVISTLTEISLRQETDVEKSQTIIQAALNSPLVSDSLLSSVVFAATGKDLGDDFINEILEKSLNHPKRGKKTTESFLLALGRNPTLANFPAVIAETPKVFNDSATPPALKLSLLNVLKFSQSTIDSSSDMFNFFVDQASKISDESSRQAWNYLIADSAVNSNQSVDRQKLIETSIKNGMSLSDLDTLFDEIKKNPEGLDLESLYKLILDKSQGHSKLLASFLKEVSPTGSLKNLYGNDDLIPILTNAIKGTNATDSTYTQILGLLRDKKFGGNFSSVLEAIAEKEEVDDNVLISFSTLVHERPEFAQISNIDSVVEKLFDRDSIADPFKKIGLLKILEVNPGAFFDTTRVFDVFTDYLSNLDPQKPLDLTKGVYIADQLVKFAPIHLGIDQEAFYKRILQSKFLYKDSLNKVVDHFLQQPLTPEIYGQLFQHPISQDTLKRIMTKADGDRTNRLNIYEKAFESGNGSAVFAFTLVPRILQGPNADFTPQQVNRFVEKMISQVTDKNTLLKLRDFCTHPNFDTKYQNPGRIKALINEKLRELH